MRVDTTNRLRLLLMVPIIALLAIALVACADDGPTNSDGPDPDDEPEIKPGKPGDTVRVVDTTIVAGDTSAISIYLANINEIGGYSLRLEYDTAYLGIVTVPGNDNLIRPIQIEREPGEGTFEQFFGGHGGANDATIIAVPGFAQSFTLPAGRGIAIQVEFFAAEDTPAGTTTYITFEDSPLDSNAYNWLVDKDANGQHRPVRVPGKVTITN